MNAIVSIICYKQKTLKDNKHPLMLRITKDGKRKYHSLGIIAVHPQHWDFQKNKPKPNCPDRDLINVHFSEKNRIPATDFRTSCNTKQYTAASLVKTSKRSFN